MGQAATTYGERYASFRPASAAQYDYLGDITIKVDNKAQELIPYRHDNSQINFLTIYPMLTQGSSAHLSAQMSEQLLLLNKTYANNMAWLLRPAKLVYNAAFYALLDIKNTSSRHTMY